MCRGGSLAGSREAQMPVSLRQRPPVATEHLALMPSRQVRYALKMPYRKHDGVPAGQAGRPIAAPCSATNVGAPDGPAGAEPEARGAHSGKRPLTELTSRRDGAV